MSPNRGLHLVPCAACRSEVGNFLYEDRMAAGRLVHELVLDHETFHFRLDQFAFHQELSINRPLYLRYHRDVYQRVRQIDRARDAVLHRPELR
jgi:hypothetical protein